MLAAAWAALRRHLQRSGGFRRMRRSDRPAALVIRGQRSGELTALDDEISDVTQSLRSLNYDVLVISEGTREAFDAILSTEFRGRLVIVHYAGHADADGFIIEDGSGSAWKLTAKHLAGLLEIATSLKLIFLNGCFAISQLKTYASELEEARKSAIDCVVVGSKNEIGDEEAARFAGAVYWSLAEGASIEEATGNVANFVISRDYSDEVAANILVALNDQGDFRLSDGWPLIFETLYRNGRTISFNALLVYAIMLAAVGVTSAYFAHGPLSSPAFQAAFSIAPDPEIEAFVTTHGRIDGPRNRLDYLRRTDPEADKPLNHFGESCTAGGLGEAPGSQGVDASVRREIAAELRFSRRYGWMVEGGRVLLLAALLLIVVRMVQQTRFPRRVPLLSRGEIGAFLRYPIGIVFLTIATLGASYIVYYHVEAAPRELARWDPGDENKSWQEQRWALLHCMPEAWGEAGRKRRSFYDRVVEPVHSDSDLEVWPSFVNSEDDSASGQIYFQMYQRPYLAYLPYSLTAFVGLLLPSLYILFMAGFQSFQWCQLAAACIPLLLRKYELNRDHVLSLLRYLRRQSNEAINILITIILAFCIAAIYEGYLGKNTLAMMARVSTVIAILLVLCGAAIITLLLTGLSQLKQTITDDVEEKDAELAELIYDMVMAFRPRHWLALVATGAVVFRLVQLLFR